MRYVIFHLDSERGLRGGERQMLVLAAELKARGHHNVIVCRAGTELERRAKDLRLETMTLPYLFEWDLLSAWLLRRRIRAVGPCIVHAHSAHTAAIAWLAARGTGSARVVHRRVDFAISGPLSAKIKYASADRVIAITDAVKRFLTDAGVPEAKISVVRSSLDAGVVEKQKDIPRDICRQAYSAEFGVDWEAAWVGTLAALVGHKDIPTLLRAAKIVLSRRPKTAFFIAGEGPLRRHLERLAQQLGVHHKVRFMGQRSDNLQILKAIDLFVLSSKQEGMGSVLLEAMACGAPIVATRAGGISEVVEDGANGLLVEPRDPEALAAAILKVLDDRALARKLADGGQERLKEFTADKMGAATEAIYKEILPA